MRSYYDLPARINIRNQYTVYKRSHPLFEKWMKQKHKKIQKNPTDDLILDLVENKKSIWIDSFGYCFREYNKNIISIEWDTVGDLLKYIPYVHTRTDLHNTQTHEELRQTYQPEIVVYFKSTIFKYLTLPELINKIKELKQIYIVEMCILVDLTFIDYNKLKYPIPDIINQLQDALPNSVLKRLSLTELLINI